MKTSLQSPPLRRAVLLTAGLAITLLAETVLPVDRGGNIGSVVAILPAACNPNQDADCDGIRDTLDNCMTAYNPDQADRDADGRGDTCDNCVAIVNLDQSDLDVDSVGDVCDNCPQAYNPDQADRDQDRNGDACDDDYDNDGVPDATDNCPRVYNSDQADRDQDRIGDACDDDYDNDGVPDATDDCPQVYNPDQADADADGGGDLCDLCPLDPTDDRFDRDGICSNIDNCPGDWNPLQDDFDVDGEGDACDVDDGLVYTWVRRWTLGWQWEFEAPQFNLYLGDLRTLRETGIYTQAPSQSPLAGSICGLMEAGYWNLGDPPGGEAVFYLVTASPGGIEASLGTDSEGRERPNTRPCQDPACDRPSQPVFHSAQGGPATPVERLIDNEADWCRFWGQPAPCDTMGIDFSREVALVATGAGSDGCHDVYITCVGAGATPEDILVKVTAIVPGTSCSCSLAFVNPIDIVKVARPVSTATFSWNTYQALCVR